MRNHPNIHVTYSWNRQSQHACILITSWSIWLLCSVRVVPACWCPLPPGAGVGRWQWGKGPGPHWDSPPHVALGRKALCSLGTDWCDDIRAKYKDEPKLQRWVFCECGVCVLTPIFNFARREALRMWKNYQGPQATYGNLLELFENAGHSECAKAVCKVLKKKCEKCMMFWCLLSNPSFFFAALRSNDVAQTAPHMMYCPKEQKGIELKSQHLVWYGKVSFLTV